jgi:hypothetical protein
MAMEYERARQSAELLRQALRDCGATHLARLVRAVGCSVEFMPLLEEEVDMLREIVTSRGDTGAFVQDERQAA